MRLLVAFVKLLVVTGFFGSGKTTFIIRAAKRLVNHHGKKVAIIVNDIGEIGIDDKVIESYGLKVKEMFGGCVCCQMSSDLPKTLKAIEKAYNPDIAIMEPSGAADPGQIMAVLSSVTGFNLDILPLTAIVDATIFTTLLAEMPLVARKIAYADVILINKVDAITERALSEVVQDVKRISSEGKLLRISAQRGLNVDQAVDYLIRE